MFLLLILRQVDRFSHLSSFLFVYFCCSLLAFCVVVLWCRLGVPRRFRFRRPHPLPDVLSLSLALNCPRWNWQPTNQFSWPKYSTKSPFHCAMWWAAARWKREKKENENERQKHTRAEREKEKQKERRKNGMMSGLGKIWACRMVFWFFLEHGGKNGTVLGRVFISILFWKCFFFRLF